MAFSRTSDVHSMTDHLPRVPVPFESVRELLADHAKKYADKEAIVAVDPDTDTPLTITYAQLASLVNRVALYLYLHHITRGDRFAILMHNTPEVLLFELAGASIGATTVPLDIKRDTLDRKIYKIKDTQAKALFIRNEQDVSQSEVDLIKESIPSLTISTWGSFTEFLHLLPHAKPITSIGTLDDFYVILYTSGTTALPKGVLLSTRACLLNAYGIIDWQQLTSDDRFNIVLPLHHINSTQFCLSMILAGGTILLNTRYSTSKFWHIVSTYKATNTSIVPTILHDLLVRADEYHQQHLDVSTLKRICIGSAPVLPQEAVRFYETFHIRVIQGYGQTETALRVAGVPVDVDDDMYQSLIKNNTIGTHLANNHLAIMDQSNNEKGEGEESEICIKGPILADGYLNNVEETKKSFVGGWFHSGDLGYWKYIDDSRNQSSSDSGNRAKQKYFFIIGRIKEIIIKGGINLSPSTIEDALLKTFPEIDEVSVVGYPDTRMGEEIAAVIVPKRSHLASQGETLRKQILNASQNGHIPGLSRFEAPKKIYFVDKLPKTSTGKIQRVEVKKSILELLKKDKQTHYYVRRIDPQEFDILTKAVEINNARWQGLPATLKEFIARAQNGLLFGVFEEHEGLVGSLSCVRLKHASVERLKTWNQATDNGTLSNHDPTGDTLLCVAISVKASRSAKPVHIGSVNVNPKQYIEEYVASGKDHVLEFHKKPKGGLPGATVWKIHENGRPEDKESMGYNVLMKYPEITKGTKIIRSNTSSPSVLLIEHALLYANKQGINNVIAFSRPAGFREYLLEEV